jgi:hypothetical protein
MWIQDEVVEAISSRSAWVAVKLANWSTGERSEKDLYAPSLRATSRGGRIGEWSLNGRR